MLNDGLNITISRSCGGHGQNTAEAVSCKHIGGGMCDTYLATHQPRFQFIAKEPCRINMLIL